MLCLNGAGRPFFTLTICILITISSSRSSMNSSSSSGSSSSSSSSRSSSSSSSSNSRSSSSNRNSSNSSLGLNQQILDFQFLPQVDLSLDLDHLPRSLDLPFALQVLGSSSQRRSLEMEIEGGDGGEGQGCLRVEWTHEGAEKVNPGTMTVLFSEGNCINPSEKWVTSKVWPSAPVLGEVDGWGFISPWLSVSAEKMKKGKGKKKEKKSKEKTELKLSQLFRPTQTLRLPLPHRPSKVTLLKRENLVHILISEKKAEDGQCLPVMPPVDHLLFAPIHWRFTHDSIVVQESDSVLVRMKKKRQGKRKEEGEGKEEREQEEKKKDQADIKRESEERLKENGKEEKVKREIKEQTENRIEVKVVAKMLGDYGFCNGSDPSNMTSVEFFVDEEEELVEMKWVYNQGRNASLYINNSLILSLDAHNHTSNYNPIWGPTWQKGDFMNNSLCHNPWFRVYETLPFPYDPIDYESEIFINCDPRTAKVSPQEASFNQTEEKNEKEEEQNEDGKEEENEEGNIKKAEKDEGKAETEDENNEEEEEEAEEEVEEDEEEEEEEEDDEETEEKAEEDFTSFYKLLLVMQCVLLACFVDTAFLVYSWLMDLWRLRAQRRETEGYVQLEIAQVFSWLMDLWRLRAHLRRREGCAQEIALRTVALILTILALVVAVLAIGILTALINDF